MMYINITKKRSWFVWLLVCAYIFRIITVNAQQHLMQQTLAEEILRFHVIANSDTEADQQVKYQVRDRILEWMDRKAEQKSGTETVYADEMQRPDKMELEYILETYKDELAGIANQVLTEAGFRYQAEIHSGTFYFPERKYGDKQFPAGWYQAFLIKLGEAKGKNWWCVFYPELCFSDCIRVVMEHEQRKNPKSELTAEAYENLLRHPPKWKIRFRWLHHVF